jgi:hypothetical protein
MCIVCVIRTVHVIEGSYFIWQLSFAIYHICSALCVWAVSRVVCMDTTSKLTGSANGKLLTKVMTLAS